MRIETFLIEDAKNETYHFTIPSQIKKVKKILCTGYGKYSQEYIGTCSISLNNPHITDVPEILVQSHYKQHTLAMEINALCSNEMSVSFTPSLAISNNYYRLRIYLFY